VGEGGEMDADSRFVAAPPSGARRAPVQIACRCPLRTHQGRVNGTIVVLNLKLRTPSVGQCILIRLR
jgi:hypothetical protein